MTHRPLLWSSSKRWRPPQPASSAHFRCLACGAAAFAVSLGVTFFPVRRAALSASVFLPGHVVIIAICSTRSSRTHSIAIYACKERLHQSPKSKTKLPTKKSTTVTAPSFRSSSAHFARLRLCISLLPRFHLALTPISSQPWPLQPAVRSPSACWLSRRLFSVGCRRSCVISPCCQCYHANAVCYFSCLVCRVRPLSCVPQGTCGSPYRCPVAR